MPPAPWSNRPAYALLQALRDAGQKDLPNSLCFFVYVYDIQVMVIVSKPRDWKIVLVLEDRLVDGLKDSITAEEIMSVFRWSPNQIVELTRCISQKLRAIAQQNGVESQFEAILAEWGQTRATSEPHLS